MTVERVDAGQVYVDLLNKIKKIESEVDPATIEEIINDLNMIFSIIPAGASQDNKLVTEDEVPADQVNADWNATSGVAEILNKPTIPAAQVNADWNAVSGVAQILNKPTIPAAQVNSDWNATSGVAEILNKPTIPAPGDTLVYDTINLSGSWVQEGDFYTLTKTLNNTYSSSYIPDVFIYPGSSHSSDVLDYRKIWKVDITGNVAKFYTKELINTIITIIIQGVKV